jgi:hypothetical protein
MPEQIEAKLLTGLNSFGTPPIALLVACKSSSKSLAGPAGLGRAARVKVSIRDYCWLWFFLLTPTCPTGCFVILPPELPEPTAAFASSQTQVLLSLLQLPLVAEQ